MKSGLRIKKADLGCLEANVLIVHPLPNVAGSAADMSNFLFAQRRSRRWTARALHAEPGAGRDDHRLLRKKANLK